MILLPFTNQSLCWEVKNTFLINITLLLLFKLLFCYICIHFITRFPVVFFSPYVAKSEQINQPSRLSLLSQLALTPINKFKPKNPPKSHKKAEADPAAGPPDEDPSPDQDVETDSSECLSFTSDYRDRLSPGLDCAICDLVSLDSQAEVDQGIFFWSWGKSQQGCSALSKSSMLLLQKVFPPLPHLRDSFQMVFSRTQSNHWNLLGSMFRLKFSTFLFIKTLLTW